MNKNKILLIPLVCLFALLLFSKNIQLIKADSGFDSSYDSGGSSSSDYSSSSSFGSSYSSSSSDGSSMSILGMAIIFELFCSIHYFVFAFRPIGRVFGRNDSKKSMIIALILFGIRALIVIVMDFINPYYFIIDFISLFILAFIVVPVLNVFKMGSKVKINSNRLNFNYNDLNDDILSKYDITDKEELKQLLFEKFVSIQEAWMNFDEHSLRLLLTDELYNMYSSQLQTLKIKGQRNIMNNFRYVDSKIFDIRQDNDVVTLRLFLNVTMFDYIVDNSSNVVRGNKSKPIDISYEITFEKSLIKGKEYCPNCGAKVIDENNPRCPYCNAVILSGSNDWVMSKKECINQK